MKRLDVGIIGAGPAGLFCAIQAAASGHRILILEKMHAPGRKLLITGSGQCNITHEGDVSDFVFHYGEHGKFLKPALLSFTNHDLMTFFCDQGLDMESREDGKVFPVSRRSVDVLSVLLNECSRREIDLHCDETVYNAIKGEGGFEIITSRGRYYAEYLVIATGGVSYPETGSDGDGYKFAAGFGHTIAGIAPALTPLIIRNFPFLDLSGISFSLMPFSVWRSGMKMFHHIGDVLFTHNGLSGPGILDCSRAIEPGDEIRLSFTGSVSYHDLHRELSEITIAHGRQQLISVIRMFGIPDRLAKKILEYTKIPCNLTCAHLSVAQRKQLIKNLTEFPVTVEKLGDFSCAMVTRGGVKLGEVNPGTMESRIKKNLFFAGEVLDIDGDSGGYNLQAAFSTGMLAAQTIKKRYSSCD